VGRPRAGAGNLQVRAGSRRSSAGPIPKPVTGVTDLESSLRPSGGRSNLKAPGPTAAQNKTSQHGSPAASWVRPRKERLLVEITITPSTHASPARGSTPYVEYGSLRH
jgi:hypothetical protein